MFYRFREKWKLCFFASFCFWLLIKTIRNQFSGHFGKFVCFFFFSFFAFRNPFLFYTFSLSYKNDFWFFLPLFWILFCSFFFSLGRIKMLKFYISFFHFFFQQFFSNFSSLFLYKNQNILRWRGKREKT